LKFKIDPDSIKYLETTEGLSFNAPLCLGRMFVGMVYDLGKGRGTYAEIAPQHVEALNQAAKDAGYPEVEFYLDSLINQAEGVTNPKSVERALDLYCQHRWKEHIEAEDSIEEHAG
jgi:hypothetical protein